MSAGSGQGDHELESFSPKLVPSKSFDDADVFDDGDLDLMDMSAGEASFDPDTSPISISFGEAVVVPQGAMPGPYRKMNLSQQPDKNILKKEGRPLRNARNLRICITIPVDRFGSRGNSEFRKTPPRTSHTISTPKQRERKKKLQEMLKSNIKTYLGAAGCPLTLRNTRQNASKEERDRYDSQQRRLASMNITAELSMNNSVEQSPGPAALQPMTTASVSAHEAHRVHRRAERHASNEMALLSKPAKSNVKRRPRKAGRSTPTVTKPKQLSRGELALKQMGMRAPLTSPEPQVPDMTPRKGFGAPNQTVPESPMSSFELAHIIDEASRSGSPTPVPRGRSTGAKGSARVGQRQRRSSFGGSTARTHRSARKKRMSIGAGARRRMAQAIRQTPARSGSLSPAGRSPLVSARRSGSRRKDPRSKSLPHRRTSKTASPQSSCSISPPVEPARVLSSRRKRQRRASMITRPSEDNSVFDPPTEEDPTPTPSANSESEPVSKSPTPELGAPGASARVTHGIPIPTQGSESSPDPTPIPRLPAPAPPARRRDWREEEKDVSESVSPRGDVPATAPLSQETGDGAIAISRPPGPTAENPSQIHESRKPEQRLDGTPGKGIPSPPKMKGQPKPRRQSLTGGHYTAPTPGSAGKRRSRGDRMQQAALSTSPVRSQAATPLGQQRARGAVTTLSTSSRKRRMSHMGVSGPTPQGGPRSARRPNTVGSKRARRLQFMSNSKKTPKRRHNILANSTPKGEFAVPQPKPPRSKTPRGVTDLLTRPSNRRQRSSDSHPSADAKASPMLDGRPSPSAPPDSPLITASAGPLSLVPNLSKPGSADAAKPAPTESESEEKSVSPVNEGQDRKHTEDAATEGREQEGARHMSLKALQGEWLMADKDAMVVVTKLRCQPSAAKIDGFDLVREQGAWGYGGYLLARERCTAEQLVWRMTARPTETVVWRRPGKRVPASLDEPSPKVAPVAPPAPRLSNTPAAKAAKKKGKLRVPSTKKGKPKEPSEALPPARTGGKKRKLPSKDGGARKRKKVSQGPEKLNWVGIYGSASEKLHPVSHISHSSSTRSKSKWMPKSKASGPKYVILDFGTSHRFNQIKIGWENSNRSGSSILYTLETATEIGSWVDRTEQASAVKGTSTDALDCTARYIKVEVGKVRKGKPGIRFIQVIGSRSTEARPSAACPVPTATAPCTPAADMRLVNHHPAPRPSPTKEQLSATVTAMQRKIMELQAQLATQQTAPPRKPPCSTPSHSHGQEAGAPTAHNTPALQMSVLEFEAGQRTGAVEPPTAPCTPAAGLGHSGLGKGAVELPLLARHNTPATLPPPSVDRRSAVGAAQQKHHKPRGSARPVPTGEGEVLLTAPTTPAMGAEVPRESSISPHSDISPLRLSKQNSERGARTLGKAMKSFKQMMQLMNVMAVKEGSPTPPPESVAEFKQSFQALCQHIESTQNPPPEESDESSAPGIPEPDSEPTAPERQLAPILECTKVTKPPPAKKRKVGRKGSAEAKPVSSGSNGQFQFAAPAPKPAKERKKAARTPASGRKRKRPPSGQLSEMTQNALDTPSTRRRGQFNSDAASVSHSVSPRVSRKLSPKKGRQWKLVIPANDYIRTRMGPNSSARSKRKLYRHVHTHGKENHKPHVLNEIDYRDGWVQFDYSQVTDGHVRKGKGSRELVWVPVWEGAGGKAPRKILEVLPSYELNQLVWANYKSEFHPCILCEIVPNETPLDADYKLLWLTWTDHASDELCYSTVKLKDMKGVIDKKGFMLEVRAQLEPQITALVKEHHPGFYDG